EKAKNADEYRHKGELVTAFLHEIKKGQKSVEVIDFYDAQQKKISISLNPLLTPSENAQAYFKKYSKMKNSVTIVKKQIQKTKAEIAYFEQLSQQVELGTPKDIEEIREELVDEGYLKRKSKQKKQKKKKVPT